MKLLAIDYGNQQQQRQQQHKKQHFHWIFFYHAFVFGIRVNFYKMVLQELFHNNFPPLFSMYCEMLFIIFPVKMKFSTDGNGKFI